MWVDPTGLFRSASKRVQSIDAQAAGKGFFSNFQPWSESIEPREWDTENAWANWRADKKEAQSPNEGQDEAEAEGQEGTPEGAQAAQQSEYGATKTGDNEYTCEIPAAGQTKTLDTSNLEKLARDEAADSTCQALNAAADDGELSRYVIPGMENSSDTVYLVDGDENAWDQQSGFYDRLSRRPSDNLSLNVDPRNHDRGALSLHGLVTHEYTEKGIIAVHGDGLTGKETQGFGRLYEQAVYEKHGGWYPRQPHGQMGGLNLTLNELRGAWPVYEKKGLLGLQESHGVIVPSQVLSGVCPSDR